jgi:hypothetical protein
MEYLRREVVEVALVMISKLGAGGKTRNLAFNRVFYWFADSLPKQDLGTKLKSNKYLVVSSLYRAML